MWRLDNPEMNYDWGSLHDIPEFCGRDAGDGPVAELWIGAHPKAPSTLLGFDGGAQPLDEAIEAHPELLGEQVVERFGRRLPFLVKLLAAGKPLSLQVHPSERLAAEGFSREEGAGLGINDPTRTYKDPHHKPEVMIALARTETLAGFRPAAGARALLEALESPWGDELAGLVDDLDNRPALELLLDSASWQRHRDDVLARCRALAERDRAFSLVVELDGHFPGDSGAAAPLLLNDVTYGPGEALFVPGGQLHAHIGGFGVEVMAASDNVIRAGLTSKHIDRTALLAAVDQRSSRPELLEVTDGAEPPVAEFRVAVLRAGDRLWGGGPKVALGVDVSGSQVDGLELARGEAAFVGDGEQPQVEGGQVWVVGVPC